MFAVVLAQLIASRLSPDSIYSIKLRRLGGYGDAQLEIGALDMLLVADAMSDEVPSVQPHLPLEVLARHARTAETRSWVVLGEDDRLAGIVSLKDLEQPVLDADLAGRTVADVMTASPMTCQPGETLRDAFKRFTLHDVFQIPVIDPDDPGKVVGMLRRTEMLWAFKELSDEQQRLLGRKDLVPSDVRGEAVQIELEVHAAHDGIALRQVRDIRFPEDAIVALLRRGGRVVVPRGFTRVEPGDVLTLITTTEHEHELRGWLSRLERDEPA
jgi:CIC family chloride channel protein